MLVTCPRCGNQISSLAPRCPHCVRRSNRWARAVLGAILFPPALALAAAIPFALRFEAAERSAGFVPPAPPLPPYDSAASFAYRQRLALHVRETLRMVVTASRSFDRVHDAAGFYGTELWADSLRERGSSSPYLPPNAWERDAELGMRYIRAMAGIEEAHRETLRAFRSEDRSAMQAAITRLKNRRDELDSVALEVAPYLPPGLPDIVIN